MRQLHVSPLTHIACSRHPPTHCCSKPAARASAVSAVAGQAIITPPALGRPWSSYTLTVCNAGTGNCSTLPRCTAAADPAADTVCAIPNLKSETSYRVNAQAVAQNGEQSSVSDASQFSTPKFA